MEIAEIDMADLKMESIKLAQTLAEPDWVAVTAIEGMPHPKILPVSKFDPGYDTWQREVRCVLVVSRRPEHRHIPWNDRESRAPIYTQCVFWYRNVSLVLDAVEVFCLSLHRPPLIEILNRLQVKQAEMGQGVMR